MLVVDNDETECYAMARLIAHAGYDVVDACAFTPALAALENPERPIDLLLTDVKMMVHGFALARMARARRPNINVIYVTGFPELAAAETPLAGSKLLVKPIDPDALIAAVDAYFSDAGA